MSHGTNTSQHLSPSRPAPLWMIHPLPFQWDCLCQNSELHTVPASSSPPSLLLSFSGNMTLKTDPADEMKQSGDNKLSNQTSCVTVVSLRHSMRSVGVLEIRTWPDSLGMTETGPEPGAGERHGLPFTNCFTTLFSHSCWACLTFTVPLPWLNIN